MYELQNCEVWIVKFEGKVWTERYELWSMNIEVCRMNREVEKNICEVKCEL